MLRLTTGAALLAALALQAPAASAHGGPPVTRHLAFHPTDPDVLVLQTSYGLLETHDGGATWQWVCPQAMDWNLGENPPFVVAEGGVVLGALFGGLARGTPDACGWAYPEPALETVTIDLARDPSNPARVLALTSAGSVDNGVWSTTDAGATWTLAQNLGAVLWERIVFAPSEASRVYVSGGNPPRGDPGTPGYEPRTAWVWASRDGGSTFAPGDRRPFPLEAADRAVRVVGVDPTDPERLYVHVSVRDADDRLVRSADGGATWATVLTVPTLYAFAVSDDGQTLFVSGLDAGLQRSTDAGGTWVTVDEGLDARCLAWRGGSLYACGRFPIDPFGLGRSTDGGETFETVHAPDRIAGMAPCAAGTSVGDTCPAWIPDLCVDVQLRTDWCVFDAPDAGVRPEDAGPPQASSEGGCAAGGPAPAGGAWALGLLGLFGLVVSARRRRPG